MPLGGVTGALKLFDEGATLPFVARYRKEVTGGLDEIELRDLRDRARYLRELADRRDTILASLREQDVLTPGLRAAIESATTRQELEDLYRPHRPRRRTRGAMAMERGLDPLADAIWSGAVDDGGAGRMARHLVGTDVPDAEAALQGARDILAEQVAEDPALRKAVRRHMRERGLVASRRARGKKDHPDAPHFRDWFDFSEPVGRIAPHRVLAIRRGESAGVLSWGIEAAEAPLQAFIERHVLADGRRARRQLELVATDCLERLLLPSVGREIQADLVEEAEADAIRIFGDNLEQLILQPPAGRRVVLGLDPGLRTGVKAAVVSSTGGVMATDTLYLFRSGDLPQKLNALLDAHPIELIAVGDGTGSRDTEQAVRETLREREKRQGCDPDPPSVVRVSEAGASVYSASEVARDELPDLDVTLRGAVSIARRLQDPLAELVKIDPRSIGVGQYQHDVNQVALQRRLDETVELCVNRVGVELNTASPALLAHVSGIGPTLAQRVVATREARGGFLTREELLEVPRLGPRAFEQSAGFLRIRDASHPLDATAVHPERYDLVVRMARDMGVALEDLPENDAVLDRLADRLDQYVTSDLGRHTLDDILAELRRPGRDPRAEFEPPAFRDDIRSPEDLREGMKLPGVVTNVVAFGCFVDLGVGRDGLVHISEMADRFVKDPSAVVSVGQSVQVRVTSVDLDRGRIALSMKSPAG